MSWRDIFNDTELSGYRVGGHGRRIGFGKKAAVVVVDMINLYLSPRFALGHGENTLAVIAADRRGDRPERRRQEHLARNTYLGA